MSLRQVQFNSEGEISQTWPSFETLSLSFKFIYNIFYFSVNFIGG